MKRGMSTAVFIFIFALILAALTLGFGIKSLRTLTGTASQVELLTFIDSLQDVAQQYATFDAGSSTSLQLSVPSSITHLCFVNPGQPITTSLPDQKLDYFMQQNIKDNLYILPLDAFKNPAPDFTIEHLTVSPQTNPLCLQTKGKLMAHIETLVQNNNIVVQITSPS